MRITCVLLILAAVASCKDSGRGGAARSVSWNGMTLPVLGHVAHKNDTVLSIKAGSQPLTELEAHYVRALTGLGWKQTDREQGLSASARELLADPEISEDIKKVWRNEQRVSVDLRKLADEIVLTIERDEEGTEVSLMYLPNVDKMRGDLEAARPCLRARLCCRVTEAALGHTCDFSDGKTLVEASDCEKASAGYVAALRAGKNEIPPECEPAE